MVTLLVADIFGHTDHLDSISEKFGSNVIVVSPYAFKQSNSKVSETHMYQLFIDTLGHDKYVDRVRKAILQYQPNMVIGFSAGASACWRALSLLPLNSVERFIGFYPSQIRHFCNLKPHSNVTLYFAQQEPHFDVSSVIQELSPTVGVECVRTRYAHGFMNAQSQNFNQHALSHYLDICVSEKERLSQNYHSDQESLVYPNEVSL